MIYYLCPDQDEPCGGIRIIYRHVDLLNEADRPAAVLHWGAGFRCTWFRHRTRVAHIPTTVLDARRDVLVIPETYGPDLARIAPGVPAVIFNQNGYLTFHAYTTDPADRRTPYTEAIASGEILGVLVESDDSARYLRYVFGPDLPLWQLHLAVDPDLFSYVPLDEKLSETGGRPLLSYMPRKAPHDAVQVVNILKFRGVLEEYGCDVVAIDGAPADEVASIMRRSVLFLAFSAQEGLPVPPREAMACGCIVVGYDGLGGREYFHPCCTVPVPMGDTLAFARGVEATLCRWRRHPHAVAEMGRRASEAITRTYTPERERDDLLGAWRAITAHAQILRRGQSGHVAEGSSSNVSSLTTAGKTSRA